MAADKQKNEPIGRPPRLIDYLRDIRVIQIILQIVFIVALVGALSIIWSSVFQTLQDSGLTPSFDFLLTRAGFQISDSPEWYSAESTYGEAFLVGIINTLRVVSIGLVGATILGILVGIFLLSSNWLIRTISRVYVEILRNTPLLVQLYFWYYVVFLSLPQFQEALGLPPEGIAFVPLKFPLYAILILVAWFVSRRTSYPARLTGGAVLAFVLYEMVSPFALDTLGFGGFGAIANLLTVVVLLVLIFAPKAWRGFAIGYLLIVIGQIVGGLLFDLLYYFGVFELQDILRLEVYPFMYMSVKGIVFPEFLVTPHFPQWLAFLGLGIVLAVAIWLISGHITETTGRPIPRGVYSFLAVVIFAAVGWFAIGLQAPPIDVTIGDGEDVQVVNLEEALEDDLLSIEEEVRYSQQPFIIALPEQGRFRTEIGSELLPEYTALLVGLVIYTSAFIAEIVRAGIQAVPYGQIEASRALGLSQTQTLTRIILPQALRVIIPPLGNQYLNLAKNSTLATAIAFQDTYTVGQTVMNQSGQSVSGFALILVVYLSMSLIISAVMNVVNSRFQLVTR